MGFAILILSLFVLPGDVRLSSGGTFTNLEEAIDRARDGDTLFLGPGRYEAQPSPYRDTICGNCVDPTEGARASMGFLVSGKSLTIIGSSSEDCTLITNAGYGIMFVDSWDSEISNLLVTGGVRDPDGRATDAAIVVKRSRVFIHDIVIQENTHRVEKVVVGIGGIFGREGAEIFILRNRILDNGWDGIALYRGAVAYIADNVIKGGRGAGIGITWDAVAVVIRNEISGYWKGIGTFGTSRAVVRNNVIHDCQGWGLIATGESTLLASFNTIYRNGNCGFATWSPDVFGYLENSVVVNNGWKKEWVCPGVGIWMNAPLLKFSLRFNDVWGNLGGDYQGVEDLTGSEGNLSVDPRLDTISLEPEEGSPLIDQGDPLILDVDGTRADIGFSGGPQAKPQK